MDIAIKLDSYQPSAWLISHVDIHFTLLPEHTLVYSKLQLQPTEFFSDTLTLDGEGLELKSLALDGADVELSSLVVTDKNLTLSGLENKPFTLSIETLIYPEKTLTLEGLYLSSGNYCTQCEAEGFRHITYFLDRPDVLATFTTTIIADKTLQPVLLGNGNLSEQKELSGNLHQAIWHDPIPKPCYLFALVAGQLVSVDDTFKTMSGNLVDLHIYVEEHNKHLCAYAMQSLKESMQWDERKYGREYDLSIFNIVAVDDFNMGAMENKSLNVFNSKYILADTDTATDTDFINIQAVVGHEYFHNWTGNRITCREWFQLSLKEGLTVFRDQEFTGDFHSKAVKRIQDVRLLKTHQFAEDKGPLSHPVRPSEYVEINNFYTLTVYEKGAEIIRMFYNFLGDETWRKVMDLYFAKFDGQAVTVEDLLGCVSEASGVDYSPMMRWYTQSGTPQVKASWAYDERVSGWQLSLEQSGSDEHYQPLLIPVKIAWVDKEYSSATQILHFKQKKQVFVFENVAQTAIPSLFQGFSAPVELEAKYSQEMLADLVIYDLDKFNQWQALQAWFSLLVFGEQTSEEEISALAGALAYLLDNNTDDSGWLAEMLSLPSLNSLAEQQEKLNIAPLYKKYNEVKQKISLQLRPLLLKHYEQLETDDLLGSESMSKRKLHNNLLALMADSKESQVLDLVAEKYQQSKNMTNRVTALSLAIQMDDQLAQKLLADFYQRYEGQSLVIDKWFALQASSTQPKAFEQVKALLKHNDFNWKNPNRLRSVLSVLTQNLVLFHQEDGAGYRLVAQWVKKIDAINPQVASRLCKSFSCLTNLEDKTKLQAEVTQLKKLPLSKDVTEILELF